MFKGFSEKTSQFFWDLSFNNERPWFQEHRQEFEDCLNAPFKALAEDTLSLMSQRFPEQEFILHISRIYRDARRLHGRGPYKEKLWFSLSTVAAGSEVPVFWFEIGAREYGFGMGIWNSAGVMEQFRRNIDANPALFAGIAEALEAYPELWPEGEEYKRSKGDYPPPISTWYNRKNPGIMSTAEFGGMLFSPELPEMLTEEYAKMMPLFCFIMDAYLMSNAQCAMRNAQLT